MKTSWRAAIWRRIGVLKKIKSYCCQRHCLTFTQIKSRHIRNDKNRDCRSPQMRIYSWALLSKRTKAHSDSQCQKTIVAMVYSKNCKGFPACNCHVKKKNVLFVRSVLTPVFCHYMDNSHCFMTISPGYRNRPLKALACVNENNMRNYTQQSTVLSGYLKTHGANSSEQ